MSDQRRRELGGPDPIDRRLGAPPPSPLRWLFSLLRTRSALGLAPSLTPAVVFLPIGVLLGPHALNLITGDVRTLLDLSVTLALTLLAVGCNSPSSKPAAKTDEPAACTCTVKVASSWCGPEEERKAKVSSLAKQAACSKSTDGKTVVDLDVAYSVEGC